MLLSIAMLGRPSGLVCRLQRCFTFTLRNVGLVRNALAERRQYPSRERNHVDWDYRYYPIRVLQELGMGEPGVITSA